MASKNQDNTFYYAQLLLKQKDPLAAKNIIAESVTDNSSRRLYLLQGDVYSELALFDSAALFYQMALVESSDTSTYSRILNSYQLSGNSVSLISHAKAAVIAFPENRTYLQIIARTLDQRYLYDEALPYYLRLYKLDTLDSLVGAELSYLQRKIAYLQRQRQQERKLADSLSQVLEEEI